MTWSPAYYHNTNNNLTPDTNHSTQSYTLTYHQTEPTNSSSRRSNRRFIIFTAFDSNFLRL